MEGMFLILVFGEWKGCVSCLIYGKGKRLKKKEQIALFQLYISVFMCASLFTCA